MRLERGGIRRTVISSTAHCGRSKKERERCQKPAHAARRGP